MIWRHIACFHQLRRMVADRNVPSVYFHCFLQAKNGRFRFACRSDLPACTCNFLLPVVRMYMRSLFRVCKRPDLQCGDCHAASPFFSVQRQITLARSFIKPERQLHVEINRINAGLRCSTTKATFTHPSPLRYSVSCFNSITQCKQHNIETTTRNTHLFVFPLPGCCQLIR